MKKRVFSVLSVLLAATMLLTSCRMSGGGKSSGDGITYWMALPASAKLSVSNFAETPIGKKWQQDTGVNVSFIHPENTEQFNLMLASNSLPDIIEYDWINAFPGGPQKAISSNQIQSFDESFIKKNAPNLYKYLNENPEMRKMCTTDDGKYYMFPFIRGDESLLISTGPIVRKDLLEKFNLEAPETMDDWYNMLKTFKEGGVSVPLTVAGIAAFLNNGMFTGAYGVTKGFFIDDSDHIAYGPQMDGYKDCLMELNKWYKEGLLDNNFMSIDGKTVDSNMTNGTSAASIGALGGAIGKWLAASSEEGYDLTAVPYPVLNKGEKSIFSALQNPIPGFGAAISTQCKDVEGAMKFLDYCYGEDGVLLMNFGVEGESYQMNDGYPQYTEMVTNNPEGKSMAEVLSVYVRATGIGAFLQDKRYIEQYSSLPQQQEAIKVWSDTDAKNHILPPFVLDSEDSSEVSKILNECQTFVDEQTTSFITGKISFDKWKSYLEQLKTFNIDRAIEIYQKAYTKYKDR